MKLFAVKSIYRWRVKGRNVSNIEERIVLFKAKSFDDAIAKAEKESVNYAKETFINPFGIPVKIEALKYFDAFEIFDELQSGCELFSTGTILGKNISNKALLKKLVDLDQKMQTKRQEKLSYYFRNAEFNKTHKE